MRRKPKMSRNRNKGRSSVQRQRIPKKSPREDLASWVGQEVVGVVRLLPNGRGSFIAENNQLPSITLFEEEIGGLFSGDRINIRIDADRRGKLKGKLLGIVERGAGLLVGTLQRSSKNTVVNTVPGNVHVVVEDPGSKIKEGHAVVVKLDPSQGRHRAVRGEIIEALGPTNHPRVQVEMAILGNGLSWGYPTAAVREAEAFGDVEPAEVLRDGRRDLRDILHVTIDGEDARDFDDAVSCLAEGDNYRVWVSIADVSHYVVTGTALDDEANRRATSVYFPHKAIHMLPTELSTGLCSLNPHLPRLSMTVEMLVDKRGLASEVSVYPGLIQSGGRLTYNQVQLALDNKRENLSSDNPCSDETIYCLVDELSKVSRWIRRHRVKRGAVDFELPERKVELDDEGTPLRIGERSRLEAHRLIEDFMIAANEAVACYLLEREWPGVYRIHECPDSQRLAMVAKWASIYGLKFDAKSNESPKAVAQFAEQLGKDERTSLGQVLLLRSMKQAKYSVENVGHFGLASEAYLHFTSPIRRYPDLLVHRSLKALWAKEGPPKDLEEKASHSSVQERSAMLIERDVTDLMACQIATHFVGEEMGARVVTVLPKGVFVRSIEHLFEGYISVEVFGDYYNEYFEFQEESMMLLGQLTGRRITFGTEVKVRLEGVNSVLRRIDFTLADRLENRRPKKAAIKGRKPLVKQKPPSGPWAEAMKKRGQGRDDSREDGEGRSGSRNGRSGKKNRQGKKKRRRF